jgi:hypothetical protein
MPTEEAAVSVIIPTMAATARAQLLPRAIDSVRRSSARPIHIIVVVNGNRFDNQMLHWLRMQPDIQCEYQETPSSPKAICRGRALVKTNFFSTLDDDDEYLDQATDIRLAAMESNPNIDLLISNGYRTTGGVDRACYHGLSGVPERPLQSLMEMPWLNSANALYRSASISAKYFEDSHSYAEWTWLAFNLAMESKKIMHLNTPTFRINDTVGSLSKTVAYDRAYESLFERMLDRTPPPDVAASIRRKQGALYHQLSDSSWQAGNRLEALKWHWRSLHQPGGLKYLAYSRHLLAARK